jgi:hypothetical protein
MTLKQKLGVFLVVVIINNTSMGCCVENLGAILVSEEVDTLINVFVETHNVFKGLKEIRNIGLLLERLSFVGFPPSHYRNLVHLRNQFGRYWPTSASLSTAAFDTSLANLNLNP